MAGLEDADPNASEGEVAPTQGADGGAYQAVNSGVSKANAENGKGKLSAADKAKIEDDVKALVKEYKAARDFDEPARRQMAKDRRYAAGTADITWAVSANLIGSFIDILCSTLYARDPDVSARKSPQVNESKTEKMEAFAQTCELVVSRLWKDANMKKAARKMIRSILSASQGWLKVLLLTEKIPQPETETALNDATELFARLTSTEYMLNDKGEPLSDDERNTMTAECERLKQALHDKVEASVRKMLTIDFVPAQNMQVSLDVSQTEDYLDADWVGNHIFVPTKSLKKTCPTVDDEDLKKATKYYQRKPQGTDKDTDSQVLLPLEKVTAESAENYTTSPQNGETGESFAKLIEIWDRRDMHIKTIIEGVTVWGKDPYEPNYTTSRFYPYFRTAFYEVDDERQPQSLAYRLSKLQDEYACMRSNQRLTRERSIPGVMFNATQLSDEQVKKISSSAQQEFIGLKPIDPAVPIGNLFAEKPAGKYDPRLYDPSQILADMDRISGVQQAMQQAAASAQPKTATEASIEQAGATSRTGTDRDLVETTLSDVALYTVQCALQSLSITDVQRICGPSAYWPAGMEIDDLNHMVEIQIEAGTTGKPKSAGDQAAWTNALPVLKEVLIDSQKALMANNKPLFDALCEILKETLKRLGDTTDIDRFIPAQAGTPPPAPPPPHPNVTISLKGELSPAAALEASQLQPPGVAAATAAGGLPPGGPPPGAPPGGPPGAPIPGAAAPPPLPLAVPEGGGGGPDLSHNPALTVHEAAPTIHHAAPTIHHAAPEIHVDKSVHLHMKSPEKPK